MFRAALVTTIISVLLALAAAPVAFADPPANDARAAAQQISVPQKLAATTVDATVEDGEPGSGCESAGVKGSVWYSLKGLKGRVAVTVVADGDLDAVIDVFERSRSQTQAVDCSRTDRRGNGIVAFDTSKSSDYLIRVSQRNNSVAGTFSLEMATAADEAGPPGDRLPAHGVTNSVNWARNPSDAWSVRLRAGASYRINLRSVGDDCPRAAVYAPGEFDRDATVSVNCNRGYALFTPRRGDGGRYTVLVSSQSGRLGDQRYRLDVAKAQNDDTSPGIFWPGSSVHGRLHGIDAVDMYNWDLRRTAIVEFRLESKASFDTLLLSPGGKRLAIGGDGESIERRLSPGQYFVAVRAAGDSSGSYTLKRTERAITHTGLTFGGGVAAPGQSVPVTARITPAVNGPVTITIERKDPIYGWQYEREVTGSAGGGTFSVSFVPPGVGRWRAKADFKGTRTANRSASGWKTLAVRRH